MHDDEQNELAASPLASVGTPETERLPQETATYIYDGDRIATILREPGRVTTYRYDDFGARVDMSGEGD